MYGKLNMKLKIILKINAQYTRNFSVNRISMLYFLTGPPRGRQRAVRAICNWTPKKLWAALSFNT
jgi:hypothetical protein